MKALVLSLLAVAGVFLSGCGIFEGINQKPAPTVEVKGKTEEFTGQIIKTDDGYRFSQAGGETFRLTRARESKEFQNEELPMRKYFGKTLVIQGINAGDGWIARVQVVGQWNYPGETRGPTQTGAEPKPKASPH